MDELRIRSGQPLDGSVRVGGAKNSVLKLMAACILAPGRHVLRNVPAIGDVDTMTEVLEVLGCRAHWRVAHELVIDVPEELPCEIPRALTDRMRASIVLLGPLLARCGEARLPLPGGDDFGGRPINFHVDGLSAMGADVSIVDDHVVAAAGGGLLGANLSLEFASHTATDNLLMAAVLAKGTTVLDNAAREPEVVDLAAMLNSMGAHIRGAGTSRIVVEGVEQLNPTEHEVVGDRIEAATFLAAVALGGGEISVEGVEAGHMRMLLDKLKEMGLVIEATDRGVRAAKVGRLGAVDVATLPYPGVATDYKPLIVAVLSVSDGTAIVTENLFLGGRFAYVDELRRMGADVRTEHHHAVVRGVDRLRGARVRAMDIRAGAALVVAGLAADGETVVSGVGHIRRGYEDLGGKLARLGADVSPMAAAVSAP